MYYCVAVAAIVCAACGGSQRSEVSSPTASTLTQTDTISVVETNDHSVTVTLDLGVVDHAEGAALDFVFALEDELIAAIDNAGVGEFDGNLIGGGSVVLYAYGPNADELFAAMEGPLRRMVFEGSSAVLRYGSSPTAEERVVALP